MGMKGKRLDPLQIESIKLRTQITELGTINFSPKVVFVGELGKFRTHKPELVMINAKAKLSFEFNIEAA